MAVPNIEKTRVNLNFPTETLNEIDEFAESMTITRTAAIVILCKQGLDSRKAVEAMATLAEMAKKQNDEVKD